MSIELYNLLFLPFNIKNVILLERAKETLKIEIEALQDLYESLDQRYLDCIELLQQCLGRIVVTGIGKSALVGQKIVATFNSTGTQAVFMHAADAVHGDLGMIADEDLVLCISKSGETGELKVLVPILKSYGIKVIAMTSNATSFLAKHADGLLYTPVKQEADPNNLAPTSSTIVQSAMGDTLATVLLQQKGFTADHFAKYHPGGSLGKQLYLKVRELCEENTKPMVQLDTPIKDILLNMSANRLGATVVCNAQEAVLGVITDGDLRRWFQTDQNQLAIAEHIMTPNPKTIDIDSLAFHAFNLMRDESISQLPVIEDTRYVGMIHINDLLREGFI